MEPSENPKNRRAALETENDLETDDPRLIGARRWLEILSARLAELDEIINPGAHVGLVVAGSHGAVTMIESLRAALLNAASPVAARTYLLECVNEAVWSREAAITLKARACAHLGETLSVDETAALAGRKPGERYANETFDTILVSARVRAQAIERIERGQEKNGDRATANKAWHDPEIQRLATLVAGDPAPSCLELFRSQWPEYAAQLSVDDLRDPLEAWAARGGPRRTTSKKRGKWMLLAQLFEKAGLGVLTPASVRMGWLKRNERTPK